MTHPDADALRAFAEHVADTGVPLDHSDAEGVLEAWHQLDTAGQGLHDALSECLGRLDVTGRCTDCGRLVLVGMWRMRSHKEGGCMTAVPGVYTAMWLAHHREAIPFYGRLMWRRRRRRHAARGLVDPTRNGQHPG
jgi:hypothetical protein